MAFGLEHILANIEGRKGQRPRYGQISPTLYHMGLAQKAAEERKKAAEKKAASMWPAKAPSRRIDVPPVPRFDPPPYSTASYATPSHGGGRKLNLFAAILGALILAAVAGSTASGLPILVAAGVGAIAGWILPFVLALVGKLIVFLARLTVATVKVALVLALIAGVVYAVVRLSAG